MNLTLHALNAFRETMRSGSISQAARTLGRTQPAVSSVISNLESELGFALFIRESGKLTPTPEAHFFLEECDTILDRLDQTRRTLAGIAKLHKGRLRIACHPAASGFFMPQLLSAFLADKPEIDVSLMMRSSRVIEDLIASQQFDLGLAETPGPRASMGQQDFDLECIVALPRHDPLADRPVITPSDLDGANMAMLFDEHAITVQTRQAFERAGARFRRRFELQTVLPGLQFVEAGMCYMICDMITAHGFLQTCDTPPGVVFRQFRPRISSGISLLWPAQAPMSLLSKSFLDLVAARLAALPGEVLRD
ncbi:LysR family transcriptional regulator [Marimonas lutisalis]|uniref:LysR family transcriptional regulator n=1 Tax=Marimonas lutisalis TaxID=2545756 RepID=UPI0010F81419|nr:LysR family transcriptional regulator [Marimonas lutisalis]